MAKEIYKVRVRQERIRTVTYRKANGSPCIIEDMPYELIENETELQEQGLIPRALPELRGLAQKIIDSGLVSDGKPFAFSIASEK